MNSSFRATCLFLLATYGLQAQSVFLNFATKPAMVQCEAESVQPCFRLNFEFIDNSGKPVEVTLPGAEQLASRIDVQLEDESVKPFYAVADQGRLERSVRPRLVLILFDVSGSMLARDLAGQSRFEGAKSAAAEYLNEFVDGHDLVAIAPFASKEVDRVIHDASFVGTRAAAQAQLDALPLPAPHNNTALYSAVLAAVERLKRERMAVSGDPEVRLLLLTDGANDVNERAGDDHGLLAGSSGLQAAADAVQQSGIDVFPIGLGDQRSIDEAAMARLGTRPPLITFDLAELRKAFKVPQIQQHGRLTATVQAPRKYGSRTLLAGRVLHFRAKLTLADGSILVENRQAPWASPPVATPSFEGECTDAEQRALLTDARAEHGSLWAMLRPIVVFMVLSGILAFLWFVLPRLLWPERYDHRAFRPIRADYWPESQVPSREASHFTSRYTPPGFEPVRQKAKVPFRGPGEHTIVQQKTEFDPNKTRLS